jgi:23S rRNA pseudouridine1911/1915/1917 synthase
LGNPILGDREYGIEGLVLNGKGLYLHAAALEFTHPLIGKEMTVEVGLPKKFLKLFPGGIYV